MSEINQEKVLELEKLENNKWKIKGLNDQVLVSRNIIYKPNKKQLSIEVQDGKGLIFKVNKMEPEVLKQEDFKKGTCYCEIVKAKKEIKTPFEEENHKENIKSSKKQNKVLNAILLVILSITYFVLGVIVTCAYLNVFPISDGEIILSKDENDKLTIVSKQDSQNGENDNSNLELYDDKGKPLTYSVVDENNYSLGFKITSEKLK